VADVLRVDRLEVGNPVALIVLVEADDFALGHGGKGNTDQPQYGSTERIRRRSYPQKVAGK
jgi:hypothetical protein